MASGTNPGWKPLTGLNDQSDGDGRLLGALLTTFDPPDPGILIEDYLPVWLGLKNSFGDEGEDRLRYFAELESSLRRLKGEITIVSTPGEVATSAEAWIWNYIRRLEVGARGPAVQHSKLWMFHRAPINPDTGETLEVVVSSANLTRDGLRGQIQAGWRCVLQLERRGSDARSGSWGILPAFLRELGRACGSAGATTTDRWLTLLRRCTPPASTAFIASVPGIHAAKTLARRQSAWGLAGLKAVLSGPSKPSLTTMAPTIGQWTGKSFTAWARFAGVELARISIAWIGERHPWAGRWQLDPSSEAALARSGARWLEAARPYAGDWSSPLCKEHQEADLRWSHAKLYELRNGMKRRLLITSANLSQAAWGVPKANGALSIENFELGVLVVQKEGLSDRLLHHNFVRATSDVLRDGLLEQPIAWLAAGWNGRTLTLECRPASQATLAPAVEISVARAKSVKQVKVTWSSGPIRVARMQWPGKSGIPILVRAKTVVGDARATAVADLRPGDDPQILCSEFDESELRQAMEAMLEEKYGYASVPESGGGGNSNGLPNGPAAAGGDYAVPAYVDARRRFQLVDNWKTDLESADDRTRDFILEDGRRIEERWRAAAKTLTDEGLRIAAKVAADELALRLGSRR